MMSVSLRKRVAPQPGHLVPGGRICSASRVYQESEPSRANNSTTALLTSLDSSNLPQASQKKTAMGTPQTRWREMHQSGRVAILLEIRSSPPAGIHCTFLISALARCRSVLLPTGASLERKHSSVP